MGTTAGRGAQVTGPVAVVVAMAAVLLSACSGGTSGTAPSTAPPATSAPGTSAPASSAPATTPVVTTSGAGTPSGPVSNSGTSTRGAAAETSLADGRYAANITGVDASRRTVTVDVVQFLTGEAAIKAAKEDGGESPPPNDYWIRNANPRLRTFTVTPGARITVNTLALEETGSATQDVRRTLAQLDAYGDIRLRLFWVTVKGGRVTGLAEQFLP